MYLNILVEGSLDEAVARRLICETGHQPGVCYGKKGIGYIRQKIQGFNQSAVSIPILTLIDFMDTDSGCPPDVITSWLPHRNGNMLCRVVVREIESWILADRNNLSDYLRVASNHIPINPEALADPKQALVNVARHSRSKSIRQALVPGANAPAQVGPLYNSVMTEFVSATWNLEAARMTSQSLDRCLSRLTELE